jgi:uncharacterized membrane protein
MPFELLIGAAVGAGLASPGVRKMVRKGVVYGLAGGLIAYDKVSGIAANIKNAARTEMAEKEAPKKTASEGNTTNGEPAPASKPAAPTELAGAV